MDISVKALPGISSLILSIIALIISGIGIYLIFLLIKTLRIYVKKNS